MASWILSAMLCAVVGGSSDCTVVYFTADWCEPCKQMEPALEHLRQDGWAIQTVDVDRRPELVRQFRIENLPTLAILCRDQEVDRMVGAAPYDRILERVERAAARNQGGLPRGRPTANLAAQDSSRVGSQHNDLHANCNHTGGAALAQAAPTIAPRTIVRGQSPALGGFPLLASNSIEGSRANDAFAQRTDMLQPSGKPAGRVEPANALQSNAVESPMAESPGNADSQPQSVEQAIARAAAATVRIRVDEANTTAYGTGTIVDVRGQEALILTCGHLFRDMQPRSQLTIDLFPGTDQEVNLPAELIDFKAEGEDIGLISFRIPRRMEPVPILGRGQSVGVGQPAFSLGCDHGANPTHRDTQIKSINRYLGADNIEIVGAPAVGRSGGGLFDMQGRLIGVCNAANAEDDEGIYASAEVIYAQIERLGLSELFDDMQQPVAAPAAPVQLASASLSQGWQQPGSQQPNRQQLNLESPASASASAAVAVAVAVAGAQVPGGGLQWPDQSASIPQLSAPDLQTASGQILDAHRAGANQPQVRTIAQAAMTGSGTQQIICIVRDAAGQDKVVTIDAPPEQLLQMIQQQSQQPGR